MRSDLVGRGMAKLRRGAKLKSVRSYLTGFYRANITMKITMLKMRAETSFQRSAFGSNRATRGFYNMRIPTNKIMSVHINRNAPKQMISVIRLNHVFLFIQTVPYRTCPFRLNLPFPQQATRKEGVVPKCRPSSWAQVGW